MTSLIRVSDVDTLFIYHSCISDEAQRYTVLNLFFGVITNNISSSQFLNYIRFDALEGNHLTSRA